MAIKAKTRHKQKNWDAKYTKCHIVSCENFLIIFRQIFKNL